MIKRLYIPVYTLTLILSAFLLFSVQPLFSKMVLPLLGGTPSVWNTSMLFFQAMLLGGYAYAHTISKLLSFKQQSVVHISLLIICCICLPLGLSGLWPEPDSSKNMIIWQLGLMLVSLGAPFFVLSGSAPLFQHWFSMTDHEDAANPYFLYGASNLGSMTALLSYPFLIEPLLTLSQQTLTWSGGYIALIGFTALSALTVYKSASKHKKVAAKETEKNSTAMDVTWKDRGSWLLLAFIPSSMMLGVTTYITTDIASIPLLWIIPLSIYVGTFIIAFSRTERFTTTSLSEIHSILLICLILITQTFAKQVPYLLMPLHLLAFAVSAQLCHSQLNKIKPHAKHLTEFYLLLSLGGVLGGVFNAIIAPLVFVLPIEYIIVLVLSTIARYYDDEEQSIDSFIKSEEREFFMRMLYTLALLIPVIIGLGVYMLQSLVIPFSVQFTQIILIYVLLLVYYITSLSRPIFLVTTAIMFLIFPYKKWLTPSQIIHLDRNFFGPSKVELYKIADHDYHQFSHGTTIHGGQIQHKDYAKMPTTYYNKPVDQIFALLDQNKKGQPQKIGALGLGVGTLACHAAPKREFTFYEIDEDVKKVAENTDLFTFLSGCGSPYTVVIGDARLKIVEAEDHSYDMIFLDAFSSDSIPLHLLTKEAFTLYHKKLKPGGILVSHISNRHLDLVPAINSLSREIGLKSVFRGTIPDKINDSGISYTGSLYGISTTNTAYTTYLMDNHHWKTSARYLPRIWTDDYANILTAFASHLQSLNRHLVYRPEDKNKEEEEENNTSEAQNQQKTEEEQTPTETPLKQLK